MRIGWFLTTYGPLGGVRSVIETGNSLIRQGHEFYLIGNVGRHRSAFCDDIIPMENHLHFNIYGDEIESARFLERIPEFDIVFNQDPVTMWFNQYVKAKVKVVHYCAGQGECYKEYVGQIDGVRTACSRLLLEIAKKHDEYGLYKKYFIGQGVNLREFRPKNLDASPYRTFRDENKVNVLCCGSRGGERKSNKGTHDIIEASKLLDPDKYNFIYFDLTRQNFPDNFQCIETIGNQKILPYVYVVADIYVAPDFVSAWNCCAGEAMACRKPVICSTQGIDDYGNDGETCLIYQENMENSPRILADKIELLADNAELRNRITENGYANIQNFPWDIVADNIMIMAKDLEII